MDEGDENSIHPSRNNLSGVLRFVSKYIRENTSGWFDEYINLFREQTDGGFPLNIQKRSSLRG